MINRFVKDVCEILEIEPPKVEKVAKLPTKTMLGRLVMPSRKVEIKSAKPSPELFLTIAHELRHLWQIENDVYPMSNYQNSSVLSVNAYNMQPMEIDAHAFSSLIMQEFFGIKPKFENLSVEVRKSIDSRISEIGL